MKIDYMHAMLVDPSLIGMLVGIWDLGTLILMFGNNALMNLFGIMMDLHNQTTQSTDWTAFTCGSSAGIYPRILIVYFNIYSGNMVLQYMQVGC